MKIFKNVYIVGFMIFGVIIFAFFITNIFFRNVDYYRNSMMLNSFLLPFIFALGAFASVFLYSRTKKVLGFKEIYKRAFLPMFMGGLLSISCIFLYINFTDKNTKDLLNFQYIESYKNSLEEEYSKSIKITKPNSPEMKDLEQKYAEGKLRIHEKIKKNEDMFSVKYFAYIFAGYCLFFLLLSLFFGIFFRTRSEK